MQGPLRAPPNLQLLLSIGTWGPSSEPSLKKLLERTFLARICIDPVSDEEPHLGESMAFNSPVNNWQDLWLLFLFCNFLFFFSFEQYKPLLVMLMQSDEKVISVLHVWSVMQVDTWCCVNRPIFDAPCVYFALKTFAPQERKAHNN